MKWVLVILLLPFATACVKDLECVECLDLKCTFYVTGSETICGYQEVLKDVRFKVVRKSKCKIANLFLNTKTSEGDSTSFLSSESSLTTSFHIEASSVLISPSSTSMSRDAPSFEELIISPTFPVSDMHSFAEKISSDDSQEVSSYSDFHESVLIVTFELTTAETHLVFPSSSLQESDIIEGTLLAADNTSLESSEGNETALVNYIEPSESDILITTEIISETTEHLAFYESPSEDSFSDFQRSDVKNSLFVTFELTTAETHLVFPSSSFQESEIIEGTLLAADNTSLESSEGNETALVNYIEASESDILIPTEIISETTEHLAFYESPSEDSFSDFQRSDVKNSLFVTFELTTAETHLVFPSSSFQESEIIEGTLLAADNTSLESSEGNETALVKYIESSESDTLIPTEIISETTEHLVLGASPTEDSTQKLFGFIPKQFDCKKKHQRMKNLLRSICRAYTMRQRLRTRTLDMAVQQWLEANPAKEMTCSFLRAQRAYCKLTSSSSPAVETAAQKSPLVNASLPFVNDEESSVWKNYTQVVDISWVNQSNVVTEMTNDTTPLRYLFEYPNTTKFDCERKDRVMLMLERSLCRLSLMSYRFRNATLDADLQEWMDDNPALNMTELCTFIRDEREFCKKNSASVHTYSPVLMIFLLILY